MASKRLSDAQQRRLSMAPAEWERMPMFSDSRPNGPLERAGLIDVRRTDLTPSDWRQGHMRVVRVEWRITDAGRTSLHDITTATSKEG